MPSEIPTKKTEAINLHDIKEINLYEKSFLNKESLNPSNSGSEIYHKVINYFKESIESFNSEFYNKVTLEFNQQKKELTGFKSEIKEEFNDVKRILSLFLRRAKCFDSDECKNLFQNLNSLSINCSQKTSLDHNNVKENKCLPLNDKDKLNQNYIISNNLGAQNKNLHCNEEKIAKTEDEIKNFKKSLNELISDFDNSFQNKKFENQNKPLESEDIHLFNKNQNNPENKIRIEIEINKYKICRDFLEFSQKAIKDLETLGKEMNSLLDSRINSANSYSTHIGSIEHKYDQSFYKNLKSQNTSKNVFNTIINQINVNMKDKVSNLFLSINFQYNLLIKELENLLSVNSNNKVNKNVDKIKPQSNIKHKYLYYLEIDISQINKMFLHVKNLDKREGFIIPLYNNMSGIDSDIFDNSLICCGGFDQRKYLRNSPFVNLETRKVDHSKKLNGAKTFAAVISTNYGIFCIGGWNIHSYSTCEYLISLKSDWKIGAHLNTPSCCITSLFLCPRYIFCLGGNKTSNIEKLNLENLDSKWEGLNIYNSCERAWGTAFQINSVEALIFGGEGSRFSNFTIFNSKNLAFEYIPSLFFLEEIHFSSSKPVYFQNYIWVVGGSPLKKYYKIDYRDLNFFEEDIDF